MGHINTDAARRATVATSPLQVRYGLRLLRAEASVTNWQTAERWRKRQRKYLQIPQKIKEQDEIKHSASTEIKMEKERSRKREKKLKQ
jgi:hypothetical protein